MRRARPLALATMLLAGLPGPARAAARSASLSVSVTVLAPGSRRPQAPAAPRAAAGAAARPPPPGSLRLTGIDGPRSSTPGR